jgi:uncharacterized protein YndB with AHSA1/START domain
MEFPEPEHSVSIIREIDVPSAYVFAAWTQPIVMDRWLGKVEVDLRVGGRYRYETPSNNGKTNTYSGVYLALDDGVRIRQSFLAGPPDSSETNPYESEFIEIRTKNLSLNRTEVTFINGWNGESITEDFRRISETAWSEWLVRMEKAIRQP